MQRYKEAILYIVFIVIGFVYGIIATRPLVSKIYHIEKDIGPKTTQVADLLRQLETLKQASEKKSETEVQTKTIYKSGEAGLETESSFTVLFDDIIDMAKYNAIKIYSVEYTYNPADDAMVKGAPDKYNVCQLDMAIISDYQDLESFLKEIFKYPSLININKIELAPYGRNKKILLTNLQIKLYSEK